MSLTDRKRQFPDEPWRWNAAWTTGVIADGNRGAAIAITLVAIVWNAVTIPMVASFFRRPPGHGEGVPFALLLIFPAVGALLAWAAVYQIARVARFGRSTLTLAPFPAHAGEPLNATVRVRASLRDATAVAAKLQCVRRERRGSGKNESTVDSVLWEDDQPATVAEGAEGTLIRATFAPAADALPTDDADPRDRIVWRCVVRAARPGVDYASTFELPLFPRRPGDATPTATPFATPFAAGAIPPPAAGLPIDELAAQRITARPLAGRGFTIEFPPARRVGAALLWTAFALGCDAVAVFAAKPHGLFGPLDVSFEGAWNAMFVVVFTLGFGLIGLILTLVAGSMWLLSTTATIDRDGLRITRSALGLSRTRTLQTGEVTTVTPKQTMTTGDRVYYALEVTPTHGKPFTFGSGIEGRHIAERLAAAVGEAMR